MYDLVTSVLSQLFIHLCATVVLTWCAVALMSNESSSSVFIFSWVSSTTSFQPSTRSRYLSSDWLRTLIDIRWFWMSRVSRLLVSFSVAWVWEAWSRTWRRTMVVNFLWALNYWSAFIIWTFFEGHHTCSCANIILWMSSNSFFSLLISSLYRVASRQPEQLDVALTSGTGS